MSKLYFNLINSQLAKNLVVCRLEYSYHVSYKIKMNIKSGSGMPTACVGLLTDYTDYTDLAQIIFGSGSEMPTEFNFYEPLRS